MHLEGSSATWWHSYEQDVREGRARDIITWNNMKRLLGQTFNNFDYQRSIRGKFNML